MALAVGSPAVFGSGLCSYVDSDGVRVFTNIPSMVYSVAVMEDACLEKDTAAENAAASLTVSVDKTVGADGFPSREFIHDLIDKYAGENRLDPGLIRSIIDTESGFNHRAVSRKGARGLMQLMPATAMSLGVQDSFDPEENIRGGTRYFRSLMDKFNNDLDLSLAAYNAGEGIVSRLGGIPNYRETREYVASVKRKYEPSKRDEVPEPVPPLPLYSYIDEFGVLNITNTDFRSFKHSAAGDSNFDEKR